jgi:hypothetical protein
MCLQSRNDKSDYPIAAKPATTTATQVSAASFRDVCLNLPPYLKLEQLLLTLDISDAYESMMPHSVMKPKYPFFATETDGDDTVVVASLPDHCLRDCKSIRDHAIATILSELVDIWTIS